MAETLRDVKPYPAHQTIIQPFDKPIKKDSHLVILRGNLAPEGAVAKISGKEGLRFTGRARVFNSEEAGDGSDPRRHDRERATSSSSATKGRAAGRACAKCFRPPPPSWARDSARTWRSSPTDGFHGGSHGFVVGHITPEAYVGGPLALVKNGDRHHD